MSPGGFCRGLAVEKLPNDKVVIYLRYVSPGLFGIKMIICGSSAGILPIECVKMKMNCYSGLCVAICDHPQSVTCELGSN